MSVPEPIPTPPRVRYLRAPSQIPDLPPDLAPVLEKVAEKYAFRANDYYLDLIDWEDPDDPIRRLIVPDAAELDDWGRLDASNEAANTVVRGVQHKYGDTALVLVASTCAAYCRFCFRKRLFMDENEEAARDLSTAYEYVEAHPKITDVLLSGGDPLVLSTDRLLQIIERFAAMANVRIIRVGTKSIAFNPYRIFDDPGLLEGFKRTVAGGTAVYLMAHFDHPRELTEPAREAIRALRETGTHVINQCPLVRGVNDDAGVLAELFETMTVLGAPQYYLFQGRPTSGNEPYKVPLVESWQIFDAARRRCSGLSRRVRFCMSHATGKIEVLGVDDHHIYLRYHRSPDPDQESRMLVCHRDDTAYWLEDLSLAVES